MFTFSRARQNREKQEKKKFRDTFHIFGTSKVFINSDARSKLKGFFFLELIGKEARRQSEDVDREESVRKSEG